MADEMVERPMTTPTLTPEEIIKQGFAEAMQRKMSIASSPGGDLVAECIIAALESHGYVIVPKEPDTAMKRALLIHRGYDPDAKEETLDTLGQLDLATMHVFIDAYRAMIRAAAKG